MAVLYGAQLVQIGRNETDLRYDIVGDNDEVFHSNDIVTVEGAGTLAVAGATDTVVGVIEKTQTMASDNETVAFVKPGIIPVSDDAIFLMGANSDLGVVAGPGTYYKLTGSTGAQQIDVSGSPQVTTSRVVEIVKVDPFNIGGTGAGSGLRQAFVRFVKTPYTNVTITA